MIPDLLLVDGVTVVDAPRSRAYADAGFISSTAQVADCGCETLEHIQGDTYTTPRGDEAVWVDDNEPASWDFGGIIPIGVEGFGSGIVSREIIPTLSGAIAGPERCGPREMRFTGVLIGATCCSVDYGLSWLRTVLRGEGPLGTRKGCGGGRLEFLDCCPTCVHTDGLAPSTCDAVQRDLPMIAGCDCYAEYARCMNDVVLVSGPTVLERIGGGCGACGGCGSIVVEWTMAAMNPSINGKVECLREMEEFPEGDDSCGDWAPREDGATDDGCDGAGGPCGGGVACTLTPPCTSGLPSPPSPPNPFDDCGCGTPLNQSVSEPVFIDRTKMPTNGDLVSTIKVYAGSETLRNFSVYYFENPQERDCSEFLDSDGRPEECLACNVITVAELPAGALLTIDGESGVAKVQCTGGSIEPAHSILTGSGGTLFDHPVMAATGYCIFAAADSDNTAEDAWWSLCVTRRTL